MTIVVAEDEMRIRQGIIKLLGRRGDEYQVVGEASNGREGLDICKKLKPDLIITDIKMPEVDGLEMLREMKKEELPTKAIVISAYSEFEYARGAMQLGVTDYLLKPISLMDFSEALKHIQEQMNDDLKKKPQQVGTLKQVLVDVLSRQVIVNDETMSYLEKHYDIHRNQNFFVICTYASGNFEKHQQKIKHDILQLLAPFSDLQYQMVEMDFRKVILTVVYHYDMGRRLEHWIQSQLLRYKDDDIVFGCVETKGIDSLAAAAENIITFLDWNISFQENILIVYPKIKEVQSSVCIYPIDIESRMRSALCVSNAKKFRESAEDFIASFNDGKIYRPKEIKESYVRFLWAMLGTARDMDLLNKDIEQQDLLEELMTACSRKELSDVVYRVLDDVDLTSEKKSADDLVVRRAESLIQEFYQTGITLDEIAEKLGITPEYLGTKFHKSLGITFSSYVKNLRITEAKKLLIGTSLKLYQIADKVGYQDAKYFSKVFREVTGMLPAQYRKAVK